MSGEETILARRARLSQVPRAVRAIFRIAKHAKSERSDVTDPNPVAIVRLPVSLVNKPTPHNNQTVPDKTTGYHSCRYITPFLCSTDKDQREEYVASLEARLAKVEVRLDKQPTQSTPASTDPPTSTPAVSKQDTSVSPAVSSEPSVYDVAQTPVGNLYEGSSSFISQFQQASEEIKQSAAAKTPEGQQSISESFNQLHSMLHDSSSRKPPPRGPTRSMPDITPLPASVVLKIIRTIKVNPTRFFPGHAMTDIKLIEHLCQKVYFPTEPVTLGHITSVNGIMRLLLREFIITEDPLSKEHDLEALKAQVERNFHLGLETFETVTVPSFENVIAITTAVLKIQNESRPVLARTLVNAGLSHCQMLGYHREITYQKDQSGFAEHKRRLFWTLYVCDKTNSLHLGNASRMQDFEVDAQYPSIPVDVAEKPWIELFHLVIRLAKIQGLIFDKLYSVAALQAPAIERRQWIDTLVADAHQWRYDLDRLDGSQVRFIKLLELSMVHWDIMYYTTLTTLLRAPAMPGVSTDMTSQCFQTARLALESHLRAFSGYDGVKLFTKADYIDWALHNSSFTPFVVIFLHSMAASSLDDVQLLEQVVDTFRHAREIHAGAERLYQICATFARLARRMVESRNTSVGMYDQNTDSLQVAGVSQDVPLIWPEAFVQPTGQGQQATSDSDVDAFLNDDMTSILADWINGQPPATEMFVMDFGE
uniref:Xylanolytic transcriptional activator regulatory domain-containing protein n=2 Tax=Gibberella zeae (strain ATCC MYA-4620 / CBS 123657 / FGSC 9075 / NRRL 31084 / PH-1) TaxID=229533 RepID=A0A098DFN8_GIBZE